MNKTHYFSLISLIFLLPSCSEWSPLPPSMNTSEAVTVTCSKTAYHHEISMDSTHVTLHRIPHGFFRGHPKVSEKTIRVPRNETRLPELISQLLAQGYYTGDTSLVPEGSFVDISQNSSEPNNPEKYRIPIDDERTGEKYDHLTDQITEEVNSQFKKQSSPSAP